MKPFLILAILWISQLSAFAQWNKIGSGIKDFAFVDKSQGYLLQVHLISPSSGNESTIKYTSNGGESWLSKYSKTMQYGSIEKVFYEWNDTCLYYESENGNLYMSEDQGVNWNYFQYTDVSLVDIDFFPDHSAYLITVAKLANSLVKINQSSFKRVIATDTVDSFNALSFISDSIGCLIGERDGIYSIYRTESPNTEWMTTYETRIPLNDIIFTSELRAYAIGDSGLVLKTDDQGLTWASTGPDLNLNLNNISCYDNNLLFCAGDSGLVLRSTNGGESWREFFLPDNDNLIKISVFEDPVIYVLSNEGDLSKSTSISFGIPNSDIDFNPYPNPFNDYIHLFCDESESVSVQVTTLDGRRIYSDEFNSVEEVEIYTADWVKSIYIITVSQGMNSKQYKMVKR